MATASSHSHSPSHPAAAGAQLANQPDCVVPRRAEKEARGRRKRTTNAVGAARAHGQHVTGTHQTGQGHPMIPSPATVRARRPRARSRDVSLATGGHWLVATRTDRPGTAPACASGPVSSGLSACPAGRRERSESDTSVSTSWCRSGTDCPVLRAYSVRVSLSLTVLSIGHAGRGHSLAVLD